MHAGDAYVHMASLFLQNEVDAVEEQQQAKVLCLSCGVVLKLHLVLRPDCVSYEHEVVAR